MNLNTTAKDSSSKNISTLTFGPDKGTSKEGIWIGRKDSLTTSAALAGFLGFTPSTQKIINAMLDSIKDSGTATSYLSNDELLLKFTIILLPSKEKISRNNHPFSPHKLTDMLNDYGLQSASKDKMVQIEVIDEDINEYACCIATAIAKTLPMYHSKSTKDSNSRKRKDREEDETESNIQFPGIGGVSVLYGNKEGKIPLDSPLYKSAQVVADRVRFSAKLGDMPPAELNPTKYSEICNGIYKGLKHDGANVTFQEIVGEELKDKGYGGIYGVGMAAQEPPRMIVMTYTPDGNVEEHVALCGKGVIYDTGGLSLKPKVGMCGMKHDMGGSAGVLGGFAAAVQLKLPRKITLILAIVENAIGKDAVRNDDILTMKSGKTVEINNTDAEGRLILSDCVSHASNSLEGGPPNVILDMATLTGAQGVATGEIHAGVLAKTKDMEDRIFKAGMKTGDLCFPLLYAPELLKKEFKSQVADMKNSVANRSNAQCSCAGHFIESHIDEAYKGDWVHVDMAYPDHKNERATGYGVALVLGLLKAPGFC